MLKDDRVWNIFQGRIRGLSLGEVAERYDLTRLRIQQIEVKFTRLIANKIFGCRVLYYISLMHKGRPFIEKGHMVKVFCGFVGGVIQESNEHFLRDVSQGSETKPVSTLHPEMSNEYLRQAGGIKFTKTHGRKAVGQRCNADKFFPAYADCYDPQEVLQYPMMHG